MPAESVKPSHFWIGTTLTLMAVLVNIWQTNSQLSAEKRQNRFSQTSTVVRDLSQALVSVSSQLESHAGMFVEMQGCLANPRNALDDCWRRRFSFDPDASGDSWRRLVVTLDYSESFVIDPKESALIDSIRQAKHDHQTRVNALLPPKTASDAAKITDAILETKEELLSIQDDLVQLLASRVSSDY